MPPLFKTIIGSDYPRIVIPLINSAKTSIEIVMYDWRWYPNEPAHVVQQLNIALVRAAQRGVKIRAVLNNELVAETLKSVGIKPHLTKARRTIHTKLLLIDRSMLVIGSHNFTRNAFTSNIETSIAVTIPTDSTRLFAFVDNLFTI